MRKAKEKIKIRVPDRYFVFERDNVEMCWDIIFQTPELADALNWIEDNRKEGVEYRLMENIQFYTAKDE